MIELQPVPLRYDTIIVGAGPAGLTSGIYMSRYLRSTLLLNGGQPRAAWVPTSHNMPGYPNGVHGRDLLSAMTEQASHYGLVPTNDMADNVIAVEGDGPYLFEVGLVAQKLRVRTKSLILATGVYNHRPDNIADDDFDYAMAHGVLRMCPICDGYEASSQGPVAVIGSSHHGLAEALFIYTYNRDITIIPDDLFQLSDSDLAKCTELGIKWVTSAARRYDFNETACTITLADGTVKTYGVVYPGLGSSPANRIAKDLGAALADDGSIIADKHSETSVPGLFAAGDVTDSVDQISVAMGQAAIACITIHNRLRQAEGTAFPSANPS